MLPNKITAFARCLLVAALFITAALAQTGTGLDVSYALPDGSLTVGEPVFLIFSVRNELDNDVWFNLGRKSVGAFHVSLTRPDGSVAPARTDRGGIAEEGFALLSPRGAYTKRLLLNQWFDFDKTGRYQMDISLRDAFRVGGTRVNDIVRTGGTPVGPASAEGHLVIVIGPRDPIQLDQICSELEKSASPAPAASGKDAQRATEAAQTLSFVVDPVAVPHLIAVLHNSESVRPPNYEILAESAIEGLARIGSRSAVEELVMEMYSPSEAIRGSALFELGGLERTTTDSAVKQRIAAILPR